MFYIKFTNQSFSTLLQEIKDNFFNAKPARAKFSKKQREEFLQEHDTCAMCKCNLTCKNMHIDHIVPLSAGGDNEPDNLQALCRPCHFAKSKKEAEEHECVKLSDTQSSFNSVTKEIITSDLSKVHAFIERFQQDDNKKTVYTFDLNKCRKNLLYHNKFELPLFTVMDEPKVYHPSHEIVPGKYYVETEQYFPLRGNGWYSHPMIEYCLTNKLIQRSDIKYVIKSSLQIEHNYFCEFIDHVYKHLPEQHAKLAINSMIGCFKLKDKEHWANIVPLSKNYNNMFYHFMKHDASNIYTRKIGNDYYYQGFKKSTIIKEETEAPLYDMILALEAIELHKLACIIEQHGGTLLEVNTDSVAAIFPDNKIPFATTNVDDKVLVDGYFYDDNNTVYKYKIEDDKDRIMGEKMAKHKRTAQYKLKEHNWNIQYDNASDDFSDYVNTIVDSNQSIHIDGRGGCGKSTLLKQIQQKLTDMDKTYITLAPTNIAALLVDGMTIHKYVAECNGRGHTKKHGSIDYIFVDEISMTQEIFYKFFLTMKRMHKHIKFIITGDFEQLLPVNDRVDCDYKSSLALHELCDGNRIQLQKCRRADDELFNLCDPQHVMKLTKNIFNNNFTDLHICFTNKKRKEINKIMMQKALEARTEQPLTLKALDYDDNSQDVHLLKNTPVICRKTSHEYNIVNNQTFTIKRIDNSLIYLSDGVDIFIEDFQKLFNVAYCVTTHKSQGSTIRQAYTIHQWEHMDRRLRYVALSRATCKEHINII